MSDLHVYGASLSRSQLLYTTREWRVATHDVVGSVVIALIFLHNSLLYWAVQGMSLSSRANCIEKAEGKVVQDIRHTNPLLFAYAVEA